MFSYLDKLLIVIPALPLVAAVVTAVFGAKVLRGASHWPTVLALVGSCLASLMLLNEVRNQAYSSELQVGWEHTVDLWTWVDVAAANPASPAGSGDFDIRVTLRADTLTASMLAMVTFVASLVAIYAAGYMHGDRGYWRFFAFVSLFVFSMTMLVSVSNFVLLYVFWEAVGACSYLLIGFWYEKPEAAAAGKKAFLVNRVGDFGFALALFLIWTSYGTLNYHDTSAEGASLSRAAASLSAADKAAADAGQTVPGVLGQTRLSTGDYVGAQADDAWGQQVALAICLLLMLGACGKSAQFPLHVWLPDAMEGPTPVSALIHAATMVTAGVYMVTRCAPLFAVSETGQLVVAGIGGFTALMAGIIAFTQTDLKRVLAYSTISQLGYMFLALGTGSLAGIAAGMFHLLTHAFFKALLFLGAGSVMHSMGGVIDMRRFGGLRRLMPITCWTFLFGCLALAGVVPFAGFFSKDAVLLAVFERGHDNPLLRVLFYGAMVTAFLTAMYTFRAFFLTFFGAEEIPPEAGQHAHESPPSMTGPLFALAVCSLFVGLLFTLSVGDKRPHAATPMHGAELEHAHDEDHDHEHEAHAPGMLDHFLSFTPSLAYVRAAEARLPVQPGAAQRHEQAHTMIAVVSSLVALAGVALAAFFYLGDRRQVEWLSKLWIVRPVHALSAGKFFFDPIYMLLVVWPVAGLAKLAYWVDRHLIDGLVDFVGSVPVALGRVLRGLQTGLVQYYAMLMVLGLLVLIGSLYLTR